MLVGTKPEEPQKRDTLVIMSDDGTADIVTVKDISEDRINGGNYAIPTGDVKSYTGPRGRIFVYPSTFENIQDARRLAGLEKSIVLRQLTQYSPPEIPDERRDITKLLPWIVIVILVIIVAVK